MLLTFAVLVRTACAGQSTTTDTICLPVPVAQKVLIAAEQKKVLEERVGLLNEGIRLLEQRIAVKDDMLSGFMQQDSLTKEIINTFSREIQVMKEQRAVLEQAVASCERDLRKMKRKVWLAGGVAAVLVTLLILK